MKSKQALIMQKLIDDGKAHNGPLVGNELGQYCASCDTAFVGHGMNFRDCPNCDAAMACWVKPKEEK